MDDITSSTIPTPLRWSGNDLYAGTLRAGWIAPGAGADPSWLGLRIGGECVYHGPSNEAARATVLHSVAWVLAKEIGA